MIVASIKNTSERVIELNIRGLPTEDIQLNIQKTH